MLRVDGLTDRTAIVTGAAGGIGEHIVSVLTANGARCAALDIRPLERSDVLGLVCDVTDEASVDEAVARVETELGSPSVLVLNAGIYPVTPFEETSVALWRQVLEVNLTGAFICAKRVLPGMRTAGYGRIVAIGSSAGKTGGARSVAAYAASKAGIMAMAKSIANEYAKFGVTANALAPALIDTPMIAEQRDLVSRIPLGRLGRPDEVADLVAFLCSAHAGFITAEVTDINGGFLVD